MNLSEFSARCDGRFEQSCYVLVNDQLTWSDAGNRCLQYGGRLASIESEAENDVIRRLGEGIGRKRV